MFLRRGVAVRVLVMALVTLAPAACGSRDDATLERRVTTAAPTTSPAPPPPTQPAPRVVVLGDSLTAGLGISADQAYPAVLQQRLRADGLDYEIINAGVSGDTSAGHPGV